MLVLHLPKQKLTLSYSESESHLKSSDPHNSESTDKIAGDGDRFDLRLDGGEDVPGHEEPFATRLGAKDDFSDKIAGDTDRFDLRLDGGEDVPGR